MVLSMTGFATKTITLQGDDGSKVNLTVSIKSLNSRFFETTFKLPYTLSSLETELIKILKAKLVRGHIYFTMQMGNQALLKGAVEPSMSTLQGYINAAEQIKQKFNVAGALTLDTLLQLPNVFIMEEKEVDQTIIQQIIDATSSVVDDLIAAKTQEGLMLKQDLLQRTAIIQKEMVQIQSAALLLLDEQKNRVTKAVTEIDLDETKLGDVRKAALYAILDKIDIHEEVVRFNSHLKKLIEHLESPDIEKGKRLDFTIQELGREINTLAAKCSDASIGARAINIKVELEKAREQTQNIV